MIKTATSLLSFYAIISFSCNNSCDGLYYIQNSKFGCDTLFIQQTEVARHDTTYIEYRQSENDTVKFKFSLKNPRFAWVRGIEKYYTNRRLVGREYSLLYIKDTIVNLGSSNANVYKYLYDYPDTYDEEAYYYWIPTIGIVQAKSAAITRTLHSCDANLDSAISGIITILNANNW